MGCGTVVAPAPLPTVESNVVVNRTAEKSIPEGYVYLYPGVQKGENVFTCPILSIHLYKKSASTTKFDTTERIINTTRRTQTPTYQLGTIQKSIKNNLSLDEDVTIICVQDIISISYRTAIKKEVKNEITSVVVPKVPKTDKSCCECVRSCFRSCCCCDEPDEPQQRQEETIQREAAKRIIVVTIEYARYGNIDTPTHIHVLKDSDRLDFYKSKFNIQTVEFYLFESADFDQAEFKRRENEAETISCLITQIKQMAPKEYPSKDKLEELVRLQVLSAFGAQYEETIVPVY